jgi:hypothetical protein
MITELHEKKAPTKIHCQLTEMYADGRITVQHVRKQTSMMMMTTMTTMLVSPAQK